VLAVILGLAVLVFIAGWVFGGALLRILGLALLVLGAAGLVVTQNAAAAFVLAIGFVMWLAGHWHYAMRHHEYASPLAQRLFQQALPGGLDPTRRWRLPVESSRHTDGDVDTPRSSEGQLG